MQRHQRHPLGGERPLGLFLSALLVLVEGCQPPPVDCEPGFVVDGRNCVDENECSTSNGGCDENRECLNAEGSSSCGACRSGYEPFGDTQCDDIDECRDNLDDCNNDENCTNLPGTFSCSRCPTGYRADGRGGCLDIDECLTDDGGCEVLRECINVDGGFACEDCPSGYDNEGDFRCTDTNECLVDNGGCNSNRPCVNEEATSSCGDCAAGYTNFGRLDCLDVDECSMGLDNCPSNKVCTNTAGTFTCEDCASGYVTDNQGGCLDVDECADNGGGCDPGMRTCVNDVGSYHCTDCPTGYANSGATTCVDVDECESNNGGCENRNCENLMGSNTCGACFSGFVEATATRCDDMNECAINNGGCDPATGCTNVPGTFACGECPGGFEVNGERLTGESECPSFVLVQILGFTFGPGPGDGTTWDGTSSVPSSTYQAIADAITGFNPIVGMAASIGGPLLASSVDAPDAFGSFTLNGDDLEYNYWRSYTLLTQDNEFTPSIDETEYLTAPPNFCGITSGPAFALAVGNFNSVLITLQEEDNLFDDDLGVVNISEAQAIAASNAMANGQVGDAWIDTSGGRDRATILEVHVIARPATGQELLDAEAGCGS